MRFLTVILILTLVCKSIAAQSNDFPFEKKVWVFWHDEDFTKAPLIAQLCSDKLKISAEKAGFEYILLNQITVRDYIPDYDQKITKVRERSYQKGLQFLADLIRFHIIHEHGGIWMDITEVLMDEFNWLVNIKSDKYKNLIANRFSDEPDVLLFYYEGYQNAAEYRIESPQHKGQYILYNQMPGYEIWFLAAKKNSSLMGQIKQTYSRFTQLPFYEIQSIFQQQNIYANNQDVDGYLTANLAISYVLQRKQFQLDQSFSLNDPYRRNLYEHYKLWSLSGLLGPLSWTDTERIPVTHFIDQPLEHFEAKGASLMFFLKLVGWMKNSISQRLQTLEGFYADKEFTVEKFIKFNPTSEQCRQISFLVNGSVLYPLFQNTTTLQSGRIKAITKEENEKWIKYCSDNYIDYEWRFREKLANFFLFLKIDSITIPWPKIHNLINFQNRSNQSFAERFHFFLEENSSSLQFFFRLFINFSVMFLVCLTIINLAWKKFLNRSISGKQNNKWINASGGQSTQLKTQQDFNTLSSKQGKFKPSLVLILIWALSLWIYFYVDFFGFRDEPFTHLVAVSAIFLLQHYIEKRIHNVKSLQILYDASYLYINFWITYVCFVLTKRNKVWLIYCTIVTSLLGPCLLRLLSRMQTKNSILNWVQHLSNNSIFRISAVIFLIILNLFPDLRYLTMSEHYLIQAVHWTSALGVTFIYFLVLVECLKTQVKLQIFRLLFLGCLSVFLYFRIPDRNHASAFNIQKIQTGFIVVAVFQTLYVQIGQSYHKQKSRDTKIFIQKSSLIHKKKYLAACFAIVFLQVYFGSFMCKSQIQEIGKFIIFEHLFLVANCFFVSLYVHIISEKAYGNIGVNKSKYEFYECEMIGSPSDQITNA